MLKNNSVKYIDEFIKLTEVGNFLYAAEELYISESNLSRHIKILESDLGHQLLQRTGHKLELTDFGLLFLQYARQFQSLDKEFIQASQDFENESARTVKVAVARSMNCDHIVNMLSDHFIVRYPQYRISPGEFSRSVSLSGSFQMGYELVFALDTNPTNEDFHCFPWRSDYLIAILPPNHTLAKKKSIHLEQLKKEPFILFPEDTFLHRMSSSLCKSSGFKPRIDFMIHGSHNIAELVSEGVGVSLANSSDVLTIKNFDLAMVALDPPPVVYLNLYYQKDKPLSKVAKTFLDFAIDIHNTHYDDIPFLGPEAGLANIYFE